MALTTLDPTTALVLIDLQKGVVAAAASRGCAQAVEQVVGQARLLASAFRRRGLPVVLVNVAGAAPGRTEQSFDPAGLPPDWTELVAALDRQPGDHAVTKRTWGAFPHTGLEALLRDLGVTHLVLAGIATSIGVESTAREAHSLGFNVTLAVDAMTDPNPEAHANSVGRIFPRLGETGTAREIINLLGSEQA
jgi:nicotinamidase-related amidase